MGRKGPEVTSETKEREETRSEVEPRMIGDSGCKERKREERGSAAAVGGVAGDRL